MPRKTLRLAMVLALPALAFAQAQAPAKIISKDDLDALVALARKDTVAHKADIVSKNMVLDAPQAAAFWPLYQRYEAERKTLGDERIAIIVDFVEHYDALDEARAKGLLERSFQNEARRIEIERKYKDEMLKALPAKLVARFFQVDRRINLLIDLTLSSKIPLAY